MASSLRALITDPTLIYIDGQQDYAGLARKTKGFEVKGLSWKGPGDTTTKSCDWAFMVGDKLVAAEEKKAGDLRTSIGSRRLQRQLRGLVQECDVPVLGLRMSALGTHNVYMVEEQWVLQQLNEWAALGRIAFLPYSAKGSLSTIEAFKKALGSGSTLSIVAGSDLKRPRASDPFVQALRRQLDGVGRVTGEKIAAYFKERGISFTQALSNRGLVDWKAAGANRRVIKQLEELRNV